MHQPVGLPPLIKENCTEMVEGMISIWNESLEVPAHAEDFREAFLDIIASGWRGLLEPTTWISTEQLIRKVRGDAVKSGRALHDSIVVWSQAEQNYRAGRKIMVTVAPSLGDDYLLASFPGGDYVAFLQQQWQQFHHTPRWNALDFVHWMFAWQDGAIGADAFLLYVWNIDLIRLLAGMQVDEAERRGEQVSAVALPPIYVPEDLVPKDLVLEWFHGMLR